MSLISLRDGNLAGLRAGRSLGRRAGGRGSGPLRCLSVAHPPRLSALPAVETLLRHPALSRSLQAIPRALVVDAVRAELAAERARLREGGPPPAPDRLAERAAARAEAASRPSL